jgi:hypothetical protein
VKLLDAFITQCWRRECYNSLWKWAQSPSWVIDNCDARPEFKPCIFSEPEANCCVHKGPPRAYNRSQSNPIHALMYCSFSNILILVYPPVYVPVVSSLQVFKLKSSERWWWQQAPRRSVSTRLHGPRPKKQSFSPIWFLLFFCEKFNTATPTIKYIKQHQHGIRFCCQRKWKPIKFAEEWQFNMMISVRASGNFTNG